MPDQPFQIGDIVCRHGYAGAWEVSAVAWMEKRWMIGVIGQGRHWPGWSSDQFTLVYRAGQSVPFCLSA